MQGMYLAKCEKYGKNFWEIQLGQDVISTPGYCTGPGWGPERGAKRPAGAVWPADRAAKEATFSFT